MLLYLGSFDGTNLALIVRLSRGRPNGACLAADHLNAVGIGALSVHSSLEGVLALCSLPFGSLKKREIYNVYMLLWVSCSFYFFTHNVCLAYKK